jgi:hypothetical protein
VQAWTDLSKNLPLSVVLAVSIGLGVFYFSAQSLGPLLDQSTTWLFPIVSGGSAILAILVVRENAWGGKFGRIHWGLMFAILSWFLGELTDAINTIYETPVVSGISLWDGFFIAGYAFAILALTQFLWDFKDNFTARRCVAAILMPSTILAAFYVFNFTIAGPEAFWAEAVNLAYPVFDCALLILGLMMLLILREDNVLSRAWLYISLGIILLALADALYVWSLLGGWYYGGHPVELPWLWGYLCLGLGFFTQRITGKTIGRDSTGVAP